MIITIENLQYHVQIRGKGYPVICLHGFAEDLTTWDNIYLSGYAFITIDMIGHGQSDKPREKICYTLDLILEHLHAVINKVVEGPYTLLGYSLGGRIALAYALQYPQGLSSLILESSSYGTEIEGERLERQGSDLVLAEKIMENGIEWFQQYWSDLSIFASQKNLPLEIQLQIQNRRLQNKEIALANMLLGMGQGVFPYLKEKIAHLNVPTLYVSGELDKKYNKIGKDFCKQNSKVQCAIVPNAGHNVHLEKADEFMVLITGFLEENFEE